MHVFAADRYRVDLTLTMVLPFVEKENVHIDSICKQNKSKYLFGDKLCFALIVISERFQLTSQLLQNDKFHFELSNTLSFT
jgi:hypothetical protein